MKALILAGCFLIFVSDVAISQNSDSSAITEKTVILNTATGKIFGTLCQPQKAVMPVPVILIVAGSGPTDRNCNSALIKTDAFLLLAHELAKKGIATLRYDKRGVGESKPALQNDSNLRFEDYIKDAEGWISFLKENKQFGKVIILGHSQGSLVAMCAANKADMYISLAGTSKPMREVLLQQLSAQPAFVKDVAFPIIDSLSNGQRVSNVPDFLTTIFVKSLQGFLISWFRYNPIVEAKEVKVPSLVIQGTNDIQINVENAKELSIALDKSKLILIDNMNHILKIVTDSDKQANLSSYNNPSLPVAKTLVEEIVKFINDGK